MPVSVHKWTPVRYLFRKAHRISLPGSSGVSLYDMGKFFMSEIRTLRIQERAAAVTYNFLMALPPTFLFVFSLVPYLPLKNVEQTVMSTIKLLTPNHKIYINVKGVVADFMTKQHHDALSFGLLMVLFFSSNGMMGLMRSFDNSLTLYKQRTGLQRRWTAVKLTIMLIVVTLIALTALIIQNKNLNRMVVRTFHNALAAQVLSFIILIIVIFVAISIIYTYGPSLKHRFKFVSVGSVFATMATVGATAIFFFLVNNFLNYNKVYGSIGTLIAFMVWVWLNTVILLLGYELNVSILLGKLSRTQQHEL